MSQLVPDDGPPRLIRFVDELRNHNLIAELDTENNLLFVVRSRFDAMTKDEQNRLIKTSKQYTFATTTPADVFA